mgnify:CR=1 FL=1
MSTSKSQRLVNLVICLRSTNAFLSAGEIRRMVQGYDDCENEAAYLRMFERDKRELREVGIPLDQGASLAPGSPAGYRIPAQGYELPDITLTPEQAGILAVAAEVWREGRSPSSPRRGSTPSTTPARRGRGRTPPGSPPPRWWPRRSRRAAS